METNNQDLIRSIKSNPMFHLSLGSKELFHTNFWYWLAQINAKETLKLFTKSIIIDHNIECFHREKNIGKDKGRKKITVVDLYYYDEKNNKKIVIENKIKDYPREEQLRRIQEKSNNAECILVTLIKYDGELHGFKQVTYKELSDNINPDIFSDDVKIRNYIQDYKDMIANLSCCMENFKRTDDYDFAPQFGTYNTLRYIKFAEVYYKYRASHLCKLLRERFPIDKYPEIHIDYSLNNGAATIDARYFVLKKKNSELIAGIQIERDQFRVVVCGSEVNKNNKFCNDLWERCKAKVWNDNFDIRSISEKQPYSYRKYGDGFRYNYHKLKEPMPYKQMFDNIQSVFNIIDTLKMELKPPTRA